MVPSLWRSRQVVYSPGRAMPTFRITEDGEFVPFEPSKAEELEAQLEDWLEDNDHVLLAPQRILYIGRQVSTDLGKGIDLLGVDEEGRAVVVELKKDRTPRDIVAQALEYTAYMRKLDYDALNSIAVRYFGTRGQAWDSLSDAHQEFYGHPGSVTWNPNQIIVLVGQTIHPDIIEVARYLRDHNVDVRVQQFLYLESSTGERIVNVQMVVGAEKLPGSPTEQGPGIKELLAAAPNLKQLFDDVQKRLGDLKWLKERWELTVLAFDRLGGRPLVNVYPSSRGHTLYLQVFRAQEIRQGGLDQFESAAKELGLTVKRGTNLSVHLRPGDTNILAELIDGFTQSFLAPEDKD